MELIECLRNKGEGLTSLLVFICSTSHSMASCRPSPVRAEQGRICQVRSLNSLRPSSAVIYADKRTSRRGEVSKPVKIMNINFAIPCTSAGLKALSKSCLLAMMSKGAWLSFSSSNSCCSSIWVSSIRRRSAESMT